MDDIKRLSAILVVLSMLIANMTSLVVSADETTNDNFTETVLEMDAETVSGEEEYTEPEEEQNQFDNDDLSEEEDYEQTDFVNAEIHSEDVSDNELLPDENISNESSEASSVNTGKGDFEGYINTKVFQVTLPVQSEGLDYLADPQGLIYKTNAAKHPDALYDSNANVYFNNGEVLTEDGKKVTGYSGRSNPLTVVNKSSCAVTVVARIKAYYEQGADNPVLLADTKDWENIHKPSIYLSVIKSDDLSEIALTQREKVVTASIAGCPDAYTYVYEEKENGETEYNYRLMTDDEMERFKADPENSESDTSFKEFSLSMTGECNSSGDWEPDIEYDFPSTSIVWNVGFAVSTKPFITVTDYSVAYGSAIDIPYSLGLYDSAASSVISAEFIPVSGESMQIFGNDAYFMIDEEVVSLTSDFSYYARTSGGGILRISFNDPEGTVIDISLDNNASPSLDEVEYSVSSTENKISIGYDLGVGTKAAQGISSITFGNTELSSSAYSTISNGNIVLSASAVRTIKMKNGGKVYVTFDDSLHTKCSVKIKVE